MDSRQSPRQRQQGVRALVRVHPTTMMSIRAGADNSFKGSRSCQPIAMSDEDSFEDRLRAIADQIVRSLSDNDIDEVAQRFGVDADRARGIAGDVERWLGGRLFDQAPRTG